MVHALKEIWRVLVRQGILLDLRPLAGKPVVEVVGPGAALAAGQLEESPESFADDQAANDALAHVSAQGLFAQERAATFDFAWYWDTLAEMQAFIAEKWTQTHVPQAVLESAQRLVAGAGAGARVRVRSRMTLSRWRRSPTATARPRPRRTARRARP
jgi:hypothetical protein